MGQREAGYRDEDNMKKMALVASITVVIVVASQVISEGEQKQRRAVNCRENPFSVL